MGVLDNENSRTVRLYDEPYFRDPIHAYSVWVAMPRTGSPDDYTSYHKELVASVRKRKPRLVKTPVLELIEIETSIWRREASDWNQQNNELRAVLEAM